MKFQCKNCDGIIISEIETGIASCGLCGADWPIPRPFSEGVVIDDFLILKKIGEGGMGDVFLAYDFPLDRNVAVKVLKSEISKDTELRNDFIKEARSVASLNHQNIVQAYKVDFDEDNNLFFVMEYVEGNTLRDIMNKEDNVNELRILEIAIDIVDALGHAWTKRQLVHRDIKPENIMISDEDGKSKLMDLGLSCHVGEEPEKEGMISGTPQYISPEQIMGNSLDIRTDFYCLGASLYHILSGREPFDGTFEEMVMKHLSESPEPLQKLRPDLSNATVEVIECLMEKEPSKRFQTAKALISALNSSKSLVSEKKKSRTSKSKSKSKDGLLAVLPLKSIINALVVLPLLCFIVYIVLTAKKKEVEVEETNDGLWTPAKINTAAWFDASDLSTITQNDDFVSVWKGKSKNSHQLIQTDRKKCPSTNLDSINSLNVLTFVSTSNTNLQLKSTIDWDYVYVVLKCLIVSNRKSSIIGSALELNDKDRDGVPDRFSGDYYINGSKSNNAKVLLKAGFFLRKAAFRGVELSVGANKFNKKIGLDGNIAELIFIGDDISVEDRRKIEGYLSHKWGLEKLLPESHVYKFKAP